MFSRSWQLIGVSCLMAGITFGAQATPAAVGVQPGAAANPAALSAPAISKSTTDHSQLEALKGPFKSGPEVTKACLSCHNTAGHQVMKSIHWTWEATSPTTGKKLGKQYAANNFCGSITSNEARCTSCHAGYGWKDKSFDFADQSNVDCLACHDNTGTYKKFGTDAGHPLYADREFEPMEGPPGKKLFKAPDLTKIAQHVGKPGRKNCGSCHFSGGGGDADDAHRVPSVRGGRSSDDAAQSAAPVPAPGARADRVPIENIPSVGFAGTVGKGHPDRLRAVLAESR